MRLSLCIATYNEETNIHYPLDSAYDLVDEVVIVDGGSTDKTVEVAKSYGKKVRIINSDNPLMFHKNKQKAIDAAKGEWLLQLDADEALSDELKQEIKIVISSQLSVVSEHKNKKKPITDNRKLTTDYRLLTTAYWIPRKNFFLTRFLLKGGQYPDHTIRLYRNGYARFPCKSVHENVEIINPKFQDTRDKQISKTKSQMTKSLDTWKLEIGYLQNPILHYADPTFSRYLARWDRYTGLEAEQLAKKIQLPTSSFQLLLMGGDYFIFKPSVWFFKTFFRHLGFMDGFPGFVFALFSSIRFWAVYVKLWQRLHLEEGK